MSQDDRWQRHVVSPTGRQQARVWAAEFGHYPSVFLYSHMSVFSSLANYRSQWKYSVNTPNTHMGYARTRMNPQWRNGLLQLCLWHGIVSAEMTVGSGRDEATASAQQGRAAFSLSCLPVSLVTVKMCSRLWDRRKEHSRTMEWKFPGRAMAGNYF